MKQSVGHDTRHRGTKILASEQSSSLLERPKSLLVRLLVLDIAFVAMFLLSIWSGSWTLMQWFNLDYERSVATSYSSAQLLVSGLLVLQTLSFYDARSGPSRGFCMLVGLGLLFLSADEASSIHERLTPLAAKYAEFIPLFRGNHGAWITIYGVIALALALLNIRNIRSLWRHHRRMFILFGVGFGTLISGAVAIEVPGYYSLVPSDTAQLAVEEGLEMAGGSIILVSVSIFFSRFAKVGAALPRRARLV